jgi:hypothetical protein
MKTAEPIISFSKASRESVYKAAKLRNDEKVISLLDLYGEELPPADNGYHRKCYQNYTHAKALKKLSLEACIPQPTTEQEAKVRVSSRKKSRGGMKREILHNYYIS